MINANTEPVEIKSFSTGEVIVAEGLTSPREMVVVIKGSIGVYKYYRKSREKFIKVVEQGGFYCEKSLFLNSEQNETVVALTAVSVMFVNKRNINEFYKKYTDIAVQISQTIYERLSEFLTEDYDNDEEVDDNEDNDDNEENDENGSDEIVNQDDDENYENENENTNNNSEENVKSIKTGEVRAEKRPILRSRVFPKGHGNYTLPLSNNTENLVFNVKTVCPLCRHEFETLVVLMSRLRRKCVDPDTRIRYNEVEPIYYEIITCPNCLFSANRQSFDEVSQDYSSKINHQLSQYKIDTPISTGRDRDTFTVFAGYYLSIICAGIVFPDYQLKLGATWHKLSRLYSDSGDEIMERYAIEQSIENYRYAYMNIRIDEKQTQQVVMVIGELNYKLGNYEDAKKTFFSIKSSGSAVDILRRRAETRIEEIRAIEKKAADEEKLAEMQDVKPVVKSGLFGLFKKNSADDGTRKNKDKK